MLRLCVAGVVQARPGITLLACWRWAALAVDKGIHTLLLLVTPHALVRLSRLAGRRRHKASCWHRPLGGLHPQSKRLAAVAVLAARD